MDYICQKNVIPCVYTGHDGILFIQYGSSPKKLVIIEGFKDSIEMIKNYNELNVEA